MKTQSEMQAHIVGKAAEDSVFRARLLEDPKAMIEQELGVTIPEGYAIEVHEETGTTAHLVLPPENRLSRDDLTAVAGGGPNWDDVTLGNSSQW